MFDTILLTIGNVLFLAGVGVGRRRLLATRVSCVFRQLSRV